MQKRERGSLGQKAPKNLSASNLILRQIIQKYCDERNISRKSLAKQMARQGINPNLVECFLRNSGRFAPYNPSPAVASAIARSFVAVSGKTEILAIYRQALLQELLLG